MAARVGVLEGDLYDAPGAAHRPRRGRALRRRRLLRPAGRRGLPHQRAGRPRAAGPGPRGRAGHPLRAHLDGVRRRPPPRQHPRGAGAAGRRPGGRAGLGARPAPGDRAPLARHRGAHRRAQEGREGAQPGRPADRRQRDRGGPQAVGQGRAGPDRHRAGAQPRLDRLLHVHQGAGRARRRGARPHQPGLDRAPEHHRVGAREPLPGLDRGLQDGGAADPGLRPRRAAGDARRRRHDRRHRARSTTSSPRSSPSWRTRRRSARRRTSTSRRATATR